MAEIANNARPQKHLSLTITLGDAAETPSTDDFNGHVSNVLCSPSSSTVTWSGGSPTSQLSDTIPGPWSLALNVGQDWENPNSLCNFLLANEGELATVRYKPHQDGEFEIETVVSSLVAPAIGGAVNAYNESTVTMGCSKPTPTYPTPTP